LTDLDLLWQGLDPIGTVDHLRKLITFHDHSYPPFISTMQGKRTKQENTQTVDRLIKMSILHNEP